MSPASVWPRRRMVAFGMISGFLVLSCLTYATLAGPLPKVWTDRDVGEVDRPGKAGFSAGTFTIAGTLDIWGKADGFHFVFQPFEGDGQIIARMTRVENTNNHAKAGVMFRESLDAGSPHATMVVTPVDGTQFLRRKMAGEVTTNTNPGRNKGQLPCWVKLVREGNKFTAYESPDGQAWTPAGSDTVPMPRRVFVGLVVSSHQKDILNTSTIDKVTISH